MATATNGLAKATTVNCLGEAHVCVTGSVFAAGLQLGHQLFQVLDLSVSTGELLA